MQIIDDYMRLRASKPEAAIGDVIAYSLDEVAAVLCCTPRNGKLVVQKLVERNWISWQPGRGRGNRSQLAFLLEPDVLIEGIAREWVYLGHVQKALTLIEAYAPSHPALADRFSPWFRGYFGMHQLREGEETVDTLRLRLDHPLLALDPATAWLRSESHLLKQVFNTLVAYQPSADKIKPLLAYHWESNERADRWTFFLRKGVLFHHGHPLRAEDVKASFARIQNPANGSHYRWMLREVARIEVLAERVIRFDLAVPNHMFPQLLASEYLSIVPAAYAVEMGAGFARLPVGTGPFKVVRNDESMLVLEAFASYFRERAHLDRIEFVILAEHGLADRMLNQSAYGIRYETVQAGQSVPEEMREWRQLQRTEWCVQYVAFNLRKGGPLQDRRLREALAMIVNGARLTRELGGNRCEPATRILPEAGDVVPEAGDVVLEVGDVVLEVGDAVPEAGDVVPEAGDVAAETSGFAPAPDRSKPSETTADPRLLLAQSSYAGQVLRLHTFTDADHREDAAWIEAACAQYGIVVESAFYDAGTLLTAECLLAADIVHDSATLTEDIEVSLLQFLLAGHSFVPQLLDERTKARIARQVRQLYGEPKRVRRLQLLTELEDELLGAVAYVPLYRNDVKLLAHPELAGVTINEQGWVEYAKLWFR